MHFTKPKKPNAMKKLLSLLFIFIFVGCAPARFVTTPNPKYETVLSLTGENDKLYVKANEWMVQSFLDAKSVIQFQDKDEGIIIGKYLLHSYLLSILLKVEIDVYALIKIMVKDNAARITIETQTPWKYSKRKDDWNIYSYSPEDAQSDINDLIDDFKNFMNKDENNW